MPRAGGFARRAAAPATRTVPLLVSFGVVLACAVAIGLLLRPVERPDGATAFDSSITSWMVAHRTPVLTALARFLATVGSQVVLTPLVVLVTAVLVVRRRFLTAGFLVGAWGGAILLYLLTKAVVGRPRPPARIWLTNVGNSTSFPSGHATQSLATFLALALLAAAAIPRLRWPARAAALILAAGVGWSRVYLGVHWTTDVLAGWAIGAAWVLAVAVTVGRPDGASGGPPCDSSDDSG